ncbi:cell adhesion molecule 3-like isoform X2 [Hemicordylus capensis]|uniref:cell adhesion molecule 3-like isoform X2 n=1 Tax=Hemicordylus capensis TaxID=884348 RepID=UPI0023041927|nr:cell adhesion molecule 3-like isoform X2 [Hemicordylus capensis]
MSPQQGKTCLPLLLLIFLFMACSVEIRDPPLLVIQTPASLNVTEGSTLSMQCRIEGNVSSISSWFKWYVCKTGGKWKVNDTFQISTKSSAQGSNLTLMTADVEDSGHYECQAGDSESSAWSNGTQVTVNGIMDLMVHQTPESITEVEGANVTMECHFRTVGRLSTMYVKWLKGEAEIKLASKNDSLIIHEDRKESVASLMLKNVNMSDSGSYRCKVEISSRSLTGLGNTSRVNIKIHDLQVNQTPPSINRTEGETLTIQCRYRVNSRLSYGVTWHKNGHEMKMAGAARMNNSEGLASLVLSNIQKSDSGMYSCDFGRNVRGNGTRVIVLEKQPDSNPITPGSGPGVGPGPGIGIGIGAGVGVGAGVILLLLVIALLVWKYKLKPKDSSKTGCASMEEDRKLHPGLTNQVSDVTYANLHFQKREVQPAAEVIYAEVKGPKQRDGKLSRT